MVRRAVEKNGGRGKGRQKHREAGRTSPAENTYHGGHGDSTGRVARNKGLKDLRWTHLKSWTKSTISHRSLNLWWHASAQGALCNCQGGCLRVTVMGGWKGVSGGGLEEETLLGVIR